MNVNLSEFMNRVTNIQNATYSRYPIKRILSRVERINEREKIKQVIDAERESEEELTH